MASTPPAGGWLKRIEQGTAEVYMPAAEDGDGTSDAAQVSPRMREVLQHMLPEGSRGRRRWFLPADLARLTGVPQGTVEVLLPRLQAFGWAESQRVDGSHRRHYRLTPGGVTRARDELDITLDEAGTLDDVDPAPPARLVAPIADGRLWTVDGLAEINPALAAAVRRRLAEGK